LTEALSPGSNPGPAAFLLFLQKRRKRETSAAALGRLYTS
jgi:hypothetical protein